MHEFHKDKQRYFEMQYMNSKNSIVPFVKDEVKLEKGTTVLEIGSAEGGVLKAFTELGCTCMGVELDASRVDNANIFMKEEIDKGLISFSAANIYDIDTEKLPHKFDLIILKDVIEHIHNQERFMSVLENFLNPGGVVFFGFPAWQMPFGGHQQLAKNKILSKMPYYHLLPMPLYKGLLKTFGESKEKIRGLEEIKETGISTRRFERLTKQNHYKILKKTKYFIAPIYEYKFGYKPKTLSKMVDKIPFINDFFTFQSYYLIKKKV